MLITILTEVIACDEVIITDKQIEHIKERHPAEYKNSIITFQHVRDKEWRRLLKNGKILYKPIV